MQSHETPRAAARPAPRGDARVAYTEAGVALYHLLRQLETSLPRLSQLPVSPGRMALLRSLALRGPRNLSELARERGVSRQGVQRLAEALEAEGLAASATDPANARARRLALTEQGLAAYRELALHEARELNALAAGLSPADLRAATRVLRLLASPERG
ncbi:MAG TPA: MarR family transcriptional regulator [Myxococcota bacterium]|nr:MarR family transcriptional regulator [Myxococcota bacterium]